MDNLTHAQSKGFLNLDWHLELDAYNEYDIEQHHLLLAAADDWDTCPCGTLSATLPRFEFGKPKDPILHDLGYRFYWALKDRKIEQAKEQLAKIEARAAYLLSLQDNIDSIPETP